jgi:hypothetical protein
MIAFKHTGVKRKAACFNLISLYTATREKIKIRREENMGKIIHTSRITITRVEGPTRKAVVEGFKEPIFYGVHGGIKQFYGIEPREEHPATLDHIIGG